MRAGYQNMQVEAAGRHESGGGRRAVPRVLAVVIGLALAVGLAELFFRSYVRQSQYRNSLEALERAPETPWGRRADPQLAPLIQLDSNPAIAYELKPNLDTEFGDGWVRTNSEGMVATREYALEVPPDTVRIVGVGDSGMFGWGAGPGENYMARLEEELRERGRAVEVLNFAVPGYNTQIEVETLRSKALRYSPHAVVLGWSDNDRVLPSFLVEHEQLEPWRLYVIEWLLDRSTLDRLLNAEPTTHLAADLDRIPPELRSGHGRDGVRRWFRELRRTSEEHGFPVLVFGNIAEWAVQALRAEGLPFLNTRAEIPRDAYPEEYGVLKIHPAPAGNVVLAELLADRLEELGWLSDAAER